MERVVNKVADIINFQIYKYTGEIIYMNHLKDGYIQELPEMKGVTDSRESMIEIIEDIEWNDEVEKELFTDYLLETIFSIEEERGED